MKIGIVDQTTEDWLDGPATTRIILSSVALALENARASRERLTGNGSTDVVFLSRGEGDHGVEGIRSIPVRQAAGRRIPARRVSALGLNALIPVGDEAYLDTVTPMVGWIPDFQHYRLPQLFTAETLTARDVRFETIARACRLVLVPGQCVARDFAEFFTGCAGKVRVASFASILWSASLQDRPWDTVGKYRLPSDYLLVTGPFCLQGNHAILPRALSLLREGGLRIPLVLAGLPADSRDARNNVLSEFLQLCRQHGVSDQVSFLGSLSEQENVSLMRCAALVAHPSKFAGWSIPVEDSKALGKPMICSDIPTHREQAPDALGFFPVDSPERLAELIAEVFPGLAPGPAANEADALAAARLRSEAFGRSLIAITREATESNIEVNSGRRFTNIGDYLRQKRSHLTFLKGKLKFRLRRFLRKLNDPIAFRVSFHDLLLLVHDLSVKCHGMELGVLRQYPPRPLVPETLPSIPANRDKLPVIAIVTPSFNQGRIIGQTIESVLGQGYPRLRYAVVDGGSTDGTVDVLRTVGRELSFWVSEADSGQSHALVKGFNQIDGDIMGYLNSDDMLMPGALRFVGSYFASHPSVDVIYGHRVVIDEDGREVGRWVLPRHHEEAIRHFDYVPQETLFWRRSLYESVGGVNQSFQFAMDWDLLLRFIRAGARFRRVPYFLGCFRLHDAQKTMTHMEVIGARETSRLLSREHGDGFSARRLEGLKHAYRIRSSLCATLMKLGVRY